MPDITMCSGEDCPKKESCYRFTATPTPLGQSYFLEPPYNKEKNECELYWRDVDKSNKNER